MAKKRIPLDEVGYRKPRKASDEELTVKLVEAMHSIMEVLATKDLTHKRVVGAIDDLFENGAIGMLISIHVDKVRNKPQYEH